MATKAELEAEVEKLKSQLTTEKPDLAALSTELDQLKSDLGKTVEERDELKKLHEAALGDSRAWKSKHDKLAVDNQELLKHFNSANEMLSDSIEKLGKTKSCAGNHVNLDGQVYDVLWRSTVKDLSIEGYQKRNVDENHTALVIAKHGG